MSDYDDDNIEFDFFETPAAEPAPRRGIPRRPKRPDGPTRPPVRPAPGVTPLLRLLGLIAAAIAVVVLLFYGVRSCAGSSRTDTYRHYMEKVDTLARSSQGQAATLNGIFATPALNEADLESKLAGLITSAGDLVGGAEDIHAPGPLRGEHQELVEALQLRRTALTSLRRTFVSTAKEKEHAGIGDVLAQQVHDRLLASDVLWKDLFQEAAKVTLQREGIKGVAPSASVFLAKPENLDATSLENLWKRVRSGAVSGKIHGTALESVKVKARPTDLVLSTTTVTALKASTNLEFVVAVKDTGDAQEARIKVTLTINQQTPIVRTATIDVINPGEVKLLTFKPFISSGQPQLAQTVRIKVEVEAVPRELNTRNNSFEYPVEFQV